MEILKNTLHVDHTELEFGAAIWEFVGFRNHLAMLKKEKCYFPRSR